MMDIKSFIIRAWSRYGIRRQLIISYSDTPPSNIKNRNIYLAQEDGENWAVAFRCPCGCGDRLELQLVPELSPNWRLTIEGKKYPTLYPSVWRKNGCKSHFWVKCGHIHWCKP